VVLSGVNQEKKHF